jgi:hypothetical protein
VSWGHLKELGGVLDSGGVQHDDSVHSHSSL